MSEYEPNWQPGPVDVAEVDRLRAELARCVEDHKADGDFHVIELERLRAEFRAELARVRGERDRLFAAHVESLRIGHAAPRPETEAVATALLAMDRFPAPTDFPRVALAEHDRRAAAGERP